MVSCLQIPHGYLYDNQRHLSQSHFKMATAWSWKHLCCGREFLSPMYMQFDSYIGLSMVFWALSPGDESITGNWQHCVVSSNTLLHFPPNLDQNYRDFFQFTPKWQQLDLGRTIMVEKPQAGDMGLWNCWYEIVVPQG